ncbi:beta-ketoacyl synthase chain length factor [Alteromonas sp. 1_MG-2023]|uniref:beta-ketoacyl synthase chain length factor n=1 Tax=Alteromonas sp. 1_MG-2023 TaxID=3062669 RepID=UPI0026E3335B|nr:beta-ketoacyl synthase chain length factor [Alteromonas sp. 1_MG-2023]MDO6566976.1 beta-ketoacyl synthase chain length factor [Alteromonas sp. 1_MG-2023]
MASFMLEAWTALAPSLNQKEDWSTWLTEPSEISEQPLNVSLKHVPMMLRRRFNVLGKCAMGAISQLAIEEPNIPCIFASQHGDTTLTLSLLESIGRQEDMSPTGFSLAVHNAVSGLYSIATKNTSEITAIAAMEGTIASAIFESVGQLQCAEKVLCVIYDTPLPSVYQPYTQGNEFPYAIAMVLSRTNGEEISLSYQSPESQTVNVDTSSENELHQFLAFLLGRSNTYTCQSNGSSWTLEKTTQHVS